MKENFIYIEKLLKENGYKLTKQRIEIISLLYDEYEHLSAEEIYSKLKGRNIGLATIYRNLNLLTKLNVLREIKIDETSYFEPKMFSKKPLHIHFRCNGCNKVFDIEESNISVKYLDINRDIEKQENIIVSDADIMLKGLCSECKKKSENK